MNFLKLLENLSDKEALDKKTSRRDSFQQFKNVGKDFALASIPFAMAATSSKTKAATASMSSAMFQAEPIEVLKFALTLEYLEREFYNKGLDSGVIDSADMPVFNTISDHEDSHVDFLLNALELQDGDMKPEFDFTGAPGGLGLDPFMENGTDQATAYAQFMALSQGFEDTGVRAYKGQAGALANSSDLLTYALQIHSVEARHASQVRRMRAEKGWITKAQNTLPDPFNAIYEGVDTNESGTPNSEANTTQGGVNLSMALSDFGDDAITEAFDEPLSMGEVNAIASFFIVPG